METAMKLAIETYASLTQKSAKPMTAQEVAQECLSDNKAILNSIQMLMFATL